MTNLRLQLNHAELELEHVIHDLEAATPCNHALRRPSREAVINQEIRDE